ncbi:hypothetical protein VFPFJ_06071 [Purpureocillium lilacinum]|uniref:Uncharacterized protein n=1 Tax=Purpureocillium lilacinum TaxID=33203 RepID=A0A179HHH0_PURLI|nr:hypothetical protein VFPFJ_06071 [Purpureocillium lilacinum]OAQ89657.1 hypothetical protein VFPFJ_06071 [Purpureocillium lilacinum]GJN69354.1 hypothetical protein PLICBS_003402 [Purpureocillium lilacinum]GJN76968.1 hypothetical protein PLIIFM63780_000456 [Purpureocillium lilacinum]
MAARGPADAAAAAGGMGGHGLRFLNDEWNDSISNGDPFTLRWNQTVDKGGSQLSLFKVTYPEDGVIVYELVTNLTESMDTAQCVWTPDHLEGGLYALWLSNGQHAHANWTISPPWVPKEEPKRNTGGHHLHWAAPIIIPVVCLLVLYGICLTAYLLHRRRKKAKRDKEDATPHQDVSRNNSVDSAVTVQTFTVDAEEFKEKYGRLRAASNGGEIWIFTDASDHADITVGGIPEKDIADVELGSGGGGVVGGDDEENVHEIDHRTIGIGL